MASNYCCITKMTEKREDNQVEGRINNQINVSESYLNLLNWLKDRKYDSSKENVGITEDIERLVLKGAEKHPWNTKLRMKRGEIHNV